MQGTITLTLSPELKQALETLTREEGISPNEVVGEALKDYLFVRQFRLLRERLIPQAEAQGIFTDEDVFELVS